MRTIKTRTRNVKQSYRVFTHQQKIQIINHVDGREENEKICDILKSYNLRPNVFYSWLKKMNITPERKRSAEFKRVTYPMTQPMVTKTNGKMTHTVTLRVEVGSILELIGFCNDIVKTPKVKSVLTVE